MHIIYWLTLCLYFGGCGFAIAKGDKAARYSAILSLVAGLVETVAVPVVLKLNIPPDQSTSIVDMSTSAISSFGLLYIAMRYASNWVALAMIIQGFEFYVNRVFLDNDSLDRASYLLQVNLISMGMGASLIGATVSAMRRRHKKRQDDIVRAQKEQARHDRIAALLAGDRGLAA